MPHGNFFRGPIPEHPTPASQSIQYIAPHLLPFMISVCYSSIDKTGRIGDFFQRCHLHQGDQIILTLI